MNTTTISCAFHVLLLLNDCVMLVILQTNAVWESLNVLFGAPKFNYSIIFWMCAFLLLCISYNFSHTYRNFDDTMKFSDFCKKQTNYWLKKNHPLIGSKTLVTFFNSLFSIIHCNCSCFSCLDVLIPSTLCLASRYASFSKKTTTNLFIINQKKQE